MIVELMNQVESPKSEQAKEMLTVTKEGTKTHVKINFSSLDVIQACPRKAHYLLDRKLVSSEQSPATEFGSGIHKALEVWYIAPPESRIVPASPKKLALEHIYKVQTDEIKPDQGLFLDAITAFIKSTPGLTHLEDTDKRSHAQGVELLANYFKHFEKDIFEVVKDKQGQPIVERLCEFTLYDSPTLKITYFGTIDLIVYDKILGKHICVDHKTTSVFGDSFFKRLSPNHQYTGYVWAAREVLGLDIDTFMVNILQVAKTKKNVGRQFTERRTEDFEELRSATILAVKNYLHCRDTSNWPMGTVNSCTMYGGCQYHKICSVPVQLRENVIRGEWLT